MNVVRVSKYLSRHLRHPSKVVTPDAEGWVDLAVLVDAAPPWVTQEAIEQAVAENDKQRFTIDFGRIRANQGHTIDVELGLVEQVPPKYLYHGTFHKAVSSIEQEGLSRMERHHVHLAAETGTAVTVGMRRGTPVVYQVSAEQMYVEGHVFYCSANGVWLVEHVPTKYLKKMP